MLLACRGVVTENAVALLMRGDAIRCYPATWRAIASDRPLRLEGTAAVLADDGSEIPLAPSPKLGHHEVMLPQTFSIGKQVGKIEVVRGSSRLGHIIESDHSI